MITMMLLELLSSGLCLVVLTATAAWRLTATHRALLRETVEIEAYAAKVIQRAYRKYKSAPSTPDPSTP